MEAERAHVPQLEYANDHESPHESAEAAYEAVLARAEKLYDAALEQAAMMPAVYIDGCAIRIDPMRYPDLVPLMHTQAFRVGLEGYLEQIVQSMSSNSMRARVAQRVLAIVKALEEQQKERADIFADMPPAAARLDALMEKLRRSATNDNETAALAA